MIITDAARVAGLVALCERVIEVHAAVRMDTSEDCDLHDRGVRTFREALDLLRPEPVCTGTTVRVRLADAPTDVLVWLVERPGIAFRIDEIAAAAAPADADDAMRSTASALRTLHGMGYVEVYGQSWTATHSGINAVLTAKAAT